MACSASGFSVLSRTTNATAASTSAFATKALCATVAVWKSPRRRCAVSAWATSTWWCLWCTFGTSRACPTRLVTCSEFPRRSSTRSSTTSVTSSSTRASLRCLRETRKTRTPCSPRTSTSTLWMRCRRRTSTSTTKTPTSLWPRWAPTRCTTCSPTWIWTN